MPKSANLDDLIACLGEKGTLRLVEARGGTRVHVPGIDFAKQGNSCLATILDQAMILKLANMFGGTQIEVPLCREWRIRQLLKQDGMSLAEIARRCGTTERNVRSLASLKRQPMPHGYNGVRRLQTTHELLRDISNDSQTSEPT